MDKGEITGPCAFDMLFRRNVPHVLEKIFFSLDYASFKTCLKVSKTWHGLLTSERFQKRGKCVYQKDILEEENKLINASMMGTVGEVRKLLSTGMVNVNCQDEHGSTPLSKAVSAGKLNVAMVLLGAGADPNKIDDNSGICPPYCLNHCTNHGFRDLIQTYLYNAARYGRLNMVQLLLDVGQDCNKTYSFGDTLLHAAAKGGHEDVVKLLLERGAEPNNMNRHGHAPLYEAAKGGHTEVVKLLLDGGAHVNSSQVCSLVLNWQTK